MTMILMIMITRIFSPHQDHLLPAHFTVHFPHIPLLVIVKFTILGLIVKAMVIINLLSSSTS